MNSAASSSASLVLFRFTGEDRPGLTASLSSLLAQFGCSIIDVNQAVIHQSLLLGLLVQIPSSEDSDRVIKEMQDRGTSLGLKCNPKRIGDHDYDAWVSRQGKSRFILTLLARSITAAQFHAVSSMLADQGLNIDVIIEVDLLVWTGSGSASQHLIRTRACNDP